MIAIAHLRVYLAALSAEGLRVHLDARPDVLAGKVVRDVDDLAARLVSQPGVAAAVRTATWPELQVLETLAACGSGASLSRIVDALSPAHAGGDLEAHADAVGAVLASLHEGLVIWPAGDHLDLNPGAGVMLNFPLGLGRRVEALLSETNTTDLTKIIRGWGRPAPTGKADLVEAIISALGDPALVRRVVATAPDDIAKYLLTRARRAAQLAGASMVAPEPWEKLANGDQARSPADYHLAQTATTWARANGLAFSAWPSYAGNAEFPCEVMLALLPARTGFAFDPVPPSLARATVTAAQVNSSAAGALTMYLSAAMATLESLARMPLAVLKNGGIGIREITGLAKRLGVDAGDIRLTLELAAPLELLGQDRTGKLCTTTRFAEWRLLAPEGRAAELSLAWMGLQGTPTLDRDEENRTIPALTQIGTDPFAPYRRLAVLTALGSGEADTGIVSAQSLTRSLGWHRPLVVRGLTEDDTARTWAEAEHLGVAAHGALSDVGRALTTRDPGALHAALRAALPPVQRSALFGSDLTVVVPGSPDAAVVDLLDATAVREARGAASTWRITPASVRSAMDDGYEAGDLITRLRELADGVLPQALEYLVLDVGRRYGRVRVQPAHAVVVGDEALLAEMEVHKALRRFELTRVAPTVLVAAAPPAVVVEALRDAGYLPRHVDAMGDSVIRAGATSPSAVRVLTAQPDGDPFVDDDELDDDDFRDGWEAEDPGLIGSPPDPVESAGAAAARLVAGLWPA